MPPSTEASQSLLTLQNILPIHIMAQADQFIRFEYKNTVFVASVIQDSVTGRDFLSLDVELCAADHPSVQQAMIGMMRANFDMSRLCLNSVTFGLRPTGDNIPTMLCLTIKHDESALTDLNWPLILDQLVQDAAVFEQAKVKAA